MVSAYPRHDEASRNRGVPPGVSRSVCYVSAMTSRRLLPFAALLGAVLVLAAGCSENRPGDTRTVLPINAIAFNDSVAKGDTLFLKVQYVFHSTCERTARFEIQVVPGTSTYQVVPVAVHAAGDNCTGVNGSDVATLRVTDVGVGSRTFQVLGSNQTITANVIGGADSAFVRETGIAFRVLVEDATTGLPLPTALVTIRNVDDNSSVAEGTADTNGRFDFTAPCGADLPYVISAAGSGRSTNLVVHTPPARCGIPEFVVIRV